MRSARRVTPALALAAVVVLGAGACSSSGSSSTSSTTAAGGSSTSAAGGGSLPSEVTIEVSDDGCKPNDVAVKAGTIKVTVKNTGSGIGELEIMTADKKVKGEAENIAPGTSQSFNSQVDAGSYTLICYETDKPTGTLTAS